MLRLYLIGPARVWLGDLEENTVFLEEEEAADVEAEPAGASGVDEVTGRIPRPQTYEEYRDMSCLAHLDPATGKSTHQSQRKWVNDRRTTRRQGYARKHRPRGKGGKGKNKDKEEDSSEAMDEDDASPEPKEGTAANKSNPFGKKSVGTYHTFLGTPTVHAKKSALRIFATAVPQDVKWSEKVCTFDRCHIPTYDAAVLEGPDRNVHAYVDDIAVMTRKGSDLISDLKETFDNLRRYKMMLNPLKCVFGVPAGKLLGFIVSHRGIEVNPEKIKAILNIKRPT
ncbi:hypothetical protein QYE76_036192 [Lolium multiflorum]|uniref:Reverse transcriptase domain-containing protein n=1 Tax=Lolium multiflorum TaxID=4521 RepID=A0AAD8R351_LOLMU|nr:hypothetical protein QYE76_036192 [Lolium multiflorum]